MQTIATGAQSILRGDSDIVLAGGIESMSRMPYLVDSEDARWGHKMGNVTLVDAMYRDGFTCSVCGLIMGETVELLAREYGITRDASDRYALDSAESGARVFRKVCRRERHPVACGRDEHPRAGRRSSLAKLPLVFTNVEGQPGIITPDVFGITDGGAAGLWPAPTLGRRAD
jgi:acetyl-CoA C-acetyltransferase